MKTTLPSTTPIYSLIAKNYNMILPHIVLFSFVVRFESVTVNLLFEAAHEKTHKDTPFSCHVLSIN
jgi:hypothetical protein